MDFVAFIGEDKESWGQIKGIANRIECDRTILIVNKKVAGFPVDSKTEIIKVNSDKPLVELKDEIKTALKAKLGKEFDAAVSLASGNGKEHMALISALLGVPIGIRLVVFTQKGVEFLD